MAAPTTQQLLSQHKMHEVQKVYRSCIPTLR